ncbi:MAG TPA: hypothetical protein VM818_14500 [Vicinamibacterales bacterium]|jgi:hypothetical protein|nr:hypothetical protein [Vicinamibacterales bacterium]
MTPIREAIVLPCVFLTVLLLGGLRIAESTALVPPSPYSLILAVLLVRVVIQSGALAPERLMATSRSELANLNGVAVLATLWLASAQAIALSIPESGLPRLALSVFFLILVLNTSAASPDRQRLLRSLAVTFGTAFVLKFVVLHAVSAPGEGAVKRALLALLDGVTVGALLQEVPDPISAYVALLTLVLFLIGVMLLPSQRRPTRLELPMPSAMSPVP